MIDSSTSLGRPACTADVIRPAQAGSRRTGAAIGLALSTLAFAAPAAADGHWASATAQATIYTLPDFTHLSGNPSQLSDGFGHTLSWFNTEAHVGNQTDTVSGKLAYSAASATLGTSSLGTLAYASNALSTSDIGVSAQARASFGDTYRFADVNDGAFAWNGRQASFAIALEGDSVNTTSRNQLDWSLSLQLFAAGTFDRPSSTWYDTLLGSGSWTGNLRSDGTRTVSVSRSGALPMTLTWSGSLANNDLQLSATFAPGADFDWSLALHSSATGLTTQLGEMSANFLHTATVGFIAPTGAVVTSASGWVPLTSPVPEPSTLAFALAGAGVIGLRLRRARQGG